MPESSVLVLVHVHLALILVSSNADTTAAHHLHFRGPPVVIMFKVRAAHVPIVPQFDCRRTMPEIPGVIRFVEVRPHADVVLTPCFVHDALKLFALNGDGAVLLKLLQHLW